MKCPKGTLTPHIYTSHPELMSNSVTCEYVSGNKNQYQHQNQHHHFIDPLRLPSCRHEPCFCLLCFHKMLQEGIEECPICNNDVTQLCSYITGKPPDFSVKDVLVEDLEIFIDVDKATKVYAHKTKQDIQLLKAHERATLKTMEQRQRKLMAMQFNNALKDVQLEQRSCGLQAGNQYDVEQLHRNNLIMSQLPSLHAKHSFVKNKSLLMAASSSSLSSNATMHMHTKMVPTTAVSMSLLERQQQAAANMKSVQAALLQKQRVADEEYSHRQNIQQTKLELQRVRLNMRSGNIQKTLQVKQQQAQELFKQKKHAAKKRLNQAKKRFEEGIQETILRAQQQQDIVEMRCQEYRQAVADERHLQKQMSERVHEARQQKLQGLRLSLQCQKEEMIGKMENNNGRRMQIKIKAERQRQRQCDEEQEKRCARTNRIQQTMRQEEQSRRRRARSLEVDSLKAEVSRKYRQEQLTARLKQEGAIREEHRRTAVFILQEDKEQNMRRMSLSMAERDKTKRKNQAIRSKTPKEMWTSPKVFGRVPRFMKKKKLLHTCATLVHVQHCNKRKKPSLQTTRSLVSSFSSPSSLLPRLRTPMDNKSNNNKGDNITITEASSSLVVENKVHPDVFRLLEKQRHQMALLLDEEEEREKERTASIRRSKPIRRKQVSKNFAFKRLKATKRIQRMEQEHHSNLLTTIRNSITV